MKIFALHHVAPTNTGDIASAPSLWVPQLAGADHIDLLDGDLGRLVRTAAHHDVVAVVGGGGLFANEWFAERLDRLACWVEALPRLRAVVWGAGWNTHYDRAAFADPALLEVAELVGVRDRGTAWPWVPCASALHPALDRPAPPTREVAVYAHHRDTALARAAARAGLAVMDNAGPEVGRAIRFISSAETVVTGSYHGSYWAALAGRRVAVCAAFSTKFDALPWPVPVSTGVDLAWAAEAAVAFPHAPDEARAANDAFAATVVDALGLGAGPPR